MIKSRLSLLKGIVLQFVIISFIVRLSLYIWSLGEMTFSVLGMVRLFATGLFFDLGVISYFCIVYLLYLLVFPNRFAGKLVDRIFGYFFYFFTTLIVMFSFFAEFTFWEEFRSRFNFIAVDYLVYTFEVVENINESYPLPLLFGGMFLLVLAVFFIQTRFSTFRNTFQSKITGLQRVVVASLLLVPVAYTAFVTNNQAEWSPNRYESELSKAGIYSFFAAFRNNELSYPDFYRTQDIDQSFAIVQKELRSANDSLYAPGTHSIKRMVKATGPERKPNVILICVESLSAEFLGTFGNADQLTPNLDSLEAHSISFRNLFATGTRTVRGMEAITLSVPPSPGQSIVKRQNNTGLFTIGEVFRQKGYSRTFFYGGDGYFDNMNDFFGGNGFDIVDRGRGYLPGDSFTAKRSNIDNNEVTFENAWGICDEDIYARVVKEADKSYAEGKPFFNFIMTTSNHRPYTYPENRIDIASGSGRAGAVKYTDWAIGKLIADASKKPWFANTVFVIMADHCASSAGRWELNVAKYHIPALIYNLPDAAPARLEQQCSQIDVIPTLFSYLNWSYESNFFGEDVTRFTRDDERAFIANYRKLGLLKGSNLAILGDMKMLNYFTWNAETNELTPVDEAQSGIPTTEVIGYYETACYMYQNQLMNMTKAAN